ncbi:YgiQ family radical SAM protein [Geotalea sp. SG265]|uniref:YgiQ family radical SAM protein n=1 Tax=Geotalea sp. SG265 TaxID=2922867 RepID=UPI001FAFB97F|nr:YgiQ family radical SAM protein [Geotalea sp. SG265]
MSFLPVSREDMEKRGWEELDIIFVSGDAYIDHPSFGIPLLARWLEFHGFRVGIIAQPDWHSKDAFMALGAPRLFFAISAGAMDSMVAHYTPARKLRHDDAYTPGNRHGARPNRATIVYTSRLKEAYRQVPVVIGGIEASLRRFAHYDFWEDKVRRSILFDAKTDLLVYGMGEAPLLELAQRVNGGEDFRSITDIRGTAFISRTAEDQSAAAREIPSFADVSSDGHKFNEAFRLISSEQNPFCGKRLIQQHDDRYLVCNPPAFPLGEKVLDAIYALPFVKAPHPSYGETIPAYEQIKSSITSHRGCFGGCAFCAITHHQGKTIQSRSEASILKEIGQLTSRKWFRGSISDIGGPTANMYGVTCSNPSAEAVCRRESCLYPHPCSNLRILDKRAAALLAKARKLAGVKHTAVSSGIRYDLLALQKSYFFELLRHHVGGLLKVAPEHTSKRVTDLMRKPGAAAFEKFLVRFREESALVGKKQHVVPYFMSGHPGTTLSDMVDLALFLKRNRLRVEQVQDFTPTPGTLSTCIYHTGTDPFTGESVHVARGDREKRLQKSLLLAHLPEERKQVMEALRACNRESAAIELLGGTGGSGCGRIPGKRKKAEK